MTKPTPYSFKSEAPPRLLSDVSRMDWSQLVAASKDSMNVFREAALTEIRFRESLAPAAARGETE